MPNFDDVLWDTPVKKLFDAKASSDKLMITVKEKALLPANATMTKNSRAWTAEVDKVKTAAKKMMGEVITLKDKIENDAGAGTVAKDLQTVKGRVEFLKALKTQLDKSNKEYSEAFAADGYRQMSLLAPMQDAGYFKIVDKKLFEKTYKKQLAARNTVIATDRRNLGERKRVEEYADRAAIIFKSCVRATKTKLAKEKEMKTSSKDFAMRQKAMVAQIASANEDIIRIRKKVESLMNGARNKNIEREKIEKMFVAAYPDLLTQRKNLAGRQKTLITALNALSKTYGSGKAAIKWIQNQGEELKKIKTVEAQLKKDLASFDKVIEALLDKTHG